MDEKIFDRIEKKYLIDVPTKKKLLSTIEKNMKEDKYFKSEIFNIYYDTDNFDLIIKSIENPDFKEKLRARFYGGFDKVFIEIKTKNRENGTRIGHKRRVLVTHKDFRKLLKNEKTVEELASKKIETPSDLQIAREVDYLINYLKLKPQILVYYDRKSYTGKNGLRITFDENLSYRDKKLDFKRTVQDKHYFDGPKKIIMEIKTHSSMPLWLTHVLSENKVFPQQFSKIGKIYDQIYNKRKEINV